DLALSFRGGRGQVRLAGVRVVAGAVGRSLRASERALVQEEELEVLPPPERPVDPRLLGVVDRLVVAERPDAAVVEIAPELRDREIVAELVGVPVVVHPGRLTDSARVRDALRAAVYRSIRGDAECGADC